MHSVEIWILHSSPCISCRMRECVTEDINEILLSFKHSTGGGGGESKFGGLQLISIPKPV